MSEIPGEKFNCATLKLIEELEKYRGNLVRCFSESIMTGWLVIRNKDITSEEVKKYVVPFLIDNPEITYLDISGNDIRDEGVVLLSKIDTLKYLDISGAHITDIGAEALSSSKSLKELIIKDNYLILKEHYGKPDRHLHITDSGAVALLLNKKLEELIFSYYREDCSIMVNIVRSFYVNFNDYKK